MDRTIVLLILFVLVLWLWIDRVAPYDRYDIEPIYVLEDAM